MVRAVNPPLPRGWGEGAPRAGASAPQAGATPSLYELSCRALAEALWRQEITSLGTLLPQDALLRIFRCEALPFMEREPELRRVWAISSVSPLAGLGPSVLARC